MKYLFYRLDCDLLGINLPFSWTQKGARMNFTTLESFSEKLSDAVTNSLQKESRESRKKLDVAWLIWQLDWLYADDDLLSDAAKTELLCFWGGKPTLKTVADHVRFHWASDVGFSWQKLEAAERFFSPPHHILKILSNLLSNGLSPVQQIKEYLLSYAGLPEDAWPRVARWLDSPIEGLANSKGAPLRSVENYQWLSSEELLQLLSQRRIGELLIQSGQLYLISLPENMARPASFSLPDGSLWIAWPQKSRPTHLHPIIQASLVCHEAAHLVQSLQKEQRGPVEQESMWQSEKAALTEEWSALLSFCASQPQKLKDLFLNNWYEENFVHQRNIFLSEMRVTSETSNSRPGSHNEHLISLPFLSAVYACLAEDIITQH